jgi:hypothetical protein
VVARGITVVKVPQYLQRCEGLQSHIAHAPMASTSEGLRAYRHFALSGIERCKSICYAKPGCTVWQYGASGCSYSIGDVPCTADEALASALTAGEHITNQCTAAPLGSSQNVFRNVVSWHHSIYAMSTACLAFALCTWVVRGRRSIEKNEVRTAVLHESEVQDTRRNDTDTPPRNDGALHPRTPAKCLRRILVLPQFFTRAPQPSSLPMPVRSTNLPPTGVLHVQYESLQSVRII